MRSPHGGSVEIDPADDLIHYWADPDALRRRLVAEVEHLTRSLPTRGSSFFIHLSELCPVACEHCMYSSDLTRKSPRDALSAAELETAIAFINDSRSEKLNITGGGEPFLKFRSMLRLLETVAVPRIEIVTAGYWARTEERADRIIRRLARAAARNRNGPRVLLRLSIDRYHLGAPRPVLIEHYANAVNAWRAARPGIALGLRSIQPDRDVVDRQLAARVGAELREVNDWNRVLVLPGGAQVPITFNVFRRSGKAASLGEEHRGHTATIREYYGPFETGAGRLSLATAVNDAIRGEYPASAGLAVTLNSDGTFWIFCGTAPDRRLRLDGRGFAEAVAYFFADPVTHLLVDEGVWALSDLVADLDPATHVAALAKNDVASLVEDLLATPEVRLAVTLLATRRLLTSGRARLPGDHPLRPLLDRGEADLLAGCRRAIGQVRGNR